MSKQGSNAKGAFTMNGEAPAINIRGITKDLKRLRGKGGVHPWRGKALFKSKSP